MTSARARTGVAAVPAPRAAPGAAAHDRARDRGRARDRPPHRPPLRGDAPGARHPDRGRARRRRRLPHPAGLPPAAADARGRRGGRGRVRARRRRPARPRRPTAWTARSRRSTASCRTRCARRVEALESTLGFTTPREDAPPVAGGAALLLADAIRRRRRIRDALPHVRGRRVAARAQPARPRRPLRALVPRRARPRPRRPAHVPRRPHARRRSSRDEPALAPPDGFDPVAHVRRSLARVPWPWEVEVLLDLPPEDARRRLPATLAELEPEGDRTLLRMRVSSLDWTAACSPGSAVPSRSASRTSCATACARSQSGSPARPASIHTRIERLAQRLIALTRARGSGNIHISFYRTKGARLMARLGGA